MKYTLTVDGNSAVEELVVGGKTYRIKWEYDEHGTAKTDTDGFCDQLERDGFDDEEFLDTVYNNIECTSFIFDALKTCSEYT